MRPEKRMPFIKKKEENGRAAASIHAYPFERRKNGNNNNGIIFINDYFKIFFYNSVLLNYNLIIGF